MIVIGVCGGSGSGKSTLCGQLISVLGTENVTHIAQDNYYHPLHYYNRSDNRSDAREDSNKEHRNYDHPDAIDFDLLNLHVQTLKSGSAIQMPQYNFATHDRENEWRAVVPSQYLILEGILIFANEKLRSSLDVACFVSAEENLRFERRVLRDQRERGRSPESIQQQFLATVAPMHNQFVEPYRHYADVIVEGQAPLNLSVSAILSTLTDHAD